VALQFIIGRGGTGKTHTCLEEIVAESIAAPVGPPLILLVPEQASFQMERELLERLAAARETGAAGSNNGANGSSRVVATARAQVLSFRRLTSRVLGEVGGQAQPRVGDLGKQMLLRSILRRRQDQLRIFGRAARQQRFAEKLSLTINELRTHGLGAAHLERRLRETLGEAGLRDISELDEGALLGSPHSAVLAMKLHDLALILKDLDHLLAGKVLDPDDILGILAAGIPDSNWLVGARIWVDGYAGFNPALYGVLEALVQKVDTVRVALLADPAAAVEEGQPLDPTDLFYPTRETLQRLEAIAHRTGVGIAEATHLRERHRFAAEPVLRYIEDQYFEAAAKPYRGEATGLRLVGATNRRAEVEAVARDILRLVRDEGYRWRHISLVFRDVEPYYDFIQSTFSSKGIPFFIDRKSPVAHHPLLELVRSALEVVSGDWQIGPLFRFLKTDLVPIDRDAVDRLENYVLAHGIRGARAWLSPDNWRYQRRYSLEVDEGEEAGRGPGPGPWDDTPQGQELAAVNAARSQVRDWLGAFHEATRSAATVTSASPTVEDLTVALFDFLGQFEIPGQLQAWEEESEALGDLTAAQEHAQVWNGFIGVVDELVEALGDETVTLAEYSDILDAGFEGLKLGLIPPALDQVLIGSIERSRQPNVKATYLLGMAEGEFPRGFTEDSIFSDSEREALQESGLELGPTSRRRNLEEHFFVYIALTRASRYLWLSYPMADEKGKARQPSLVVNRLQRLLPDVKMETVDLVPDGSDPLAFVVDPEEAAGILARELAESRRGGRPLDNFWLHLYDLLVTNVGWSAQARGRLAGLSYKNTLAPLPEPLVRELLGNPLRLSVSRLEAYAGCPFRFLAQNGLKLQERARQQIDAASLGSFFHVALSIFVQRLIDSGIDWGVLPTEDAETIIDEIVDELAPRLGNELLLSSARHANLVESLRRILRRTVRVLGLHASEGEFRPVGVEVSFGLGGGLPPYEMEFSDDWTLRLRGQIDRIDAVDINGDTYIRVIDYKSSRQRYGLDDIFHGLKLQLLVYLRVALEFAPLLLGRAARPAGVLYYAVQDPLIRAPAVASAASVETDIVKGLKMTGYLLANEEVVEKMCQGLDTDINHLLPVGFKKDGDFTAHSRVLSEGEFFKLLDYTGLKVLETAEGIASGDFSIRPYRRGLTQRACQWCPYLPLCQFDVVVKGCDYRDLPRMDKERVWEEIDAILNSQPAIIALSPPPTGGAPPPPPQGDSVGDQGPTEGGE